MRAQFNNVYIRAIAACSGKTLHNVATTCQSFLDEKHAKRLVKTLGFENVREVPLTMTTSDISRNHAVRLLHFYLKSTRLAVGLTWNSDNDAEVELLVDCIIDAACQQADEERQAQAAQPGE